MTARVISAISITAVLVGGLLVGLYYGGILSNRVQANYNKRVVTSRVQQNVRQPEFAQAVYEQFFTDCNAVVADNMKIAQARERIAMLRLLPDDLFGQKQARLSDAVTDLTGLQQIQTETAARYNAAAAEYTRGQFLAASLPQRLDPPYQVACKGDDQ